MATEIESASTSQNIGSLLTLSREHGRQLHAIFTKLDGVKSLAERNEGVVTTVQKLAERNEAELKVHDEQIRLVSSAVAQMPDKVAATVVQKINGNPGGSNPKPKQTVMERLELGPGGLKTVGIGVGGVCVIVAVITLALMILKFHGVIGG